MTDNPDEAPEQERPQLARTPSELASFLATQDSFRNFLLEQTALREIARRAVRDSMAINVMPSMLDSVVANMRLMDQVNKGALGQGHRLAAAQLAELKYGFGALSSWRTAIAAQGALGQFMRDIHGFSLAYRSAFRQLAAVSRVQVHFTDWIVQLDAAPKLLTDNSSRPLSAWRDHITALPTPPSLAQVKTSTAAGQGSTGLIGADALISGVKEDEDVTLEIADRVESDLLEPWESGRLSVAAELRAVLSEVHAKAADSLDGAWDLLRGKNPVRAALMAQCVVEAVDQVLRAAAPEEKVVEWLPRSGRPEREWYGQPGRPTRPMRIRYIAQKTNADLKLVLPQVDSWVALAGKLMNDAQGLKHGSGPENVLKARALLVTAEAFLITLFMGA